MTDVVREIMSRKFEEFSPELWRASIADRQVCLDVVRRMDDPTAFALATFVLAEYWTPDQAVIERCRDVLDNKVIDEAYRIHALSYLGHVHDGTKDPVTVASLVSVIRDELTDSRVGNVPLGCRGHLTGYEQTEGNR